MGLITYLKNSYEELNTKVSWPSWSELQGSSVVVLIASLLIALVVGFMDFAFSFSMTTIYDFLF
ncbi:MAG: preprotein translocase subunit SecE [Flavobacteriales bacterium]